MSEGITLEETSSLLGCFLFSGISENESIKLIEPYMNLDNGIKAAFFTRKQSVPSGVVGLVISGLLTVCRGENDEILLNTVAAGGVFGAASLFAGGFKTSVVARKKSRVLMISRECVNSLVMADNRIAINYITFLSRKISFLNGKIATFTTVSAEERLLEYLESLGGAGNTATLPMSMNSLAEWLSVSRASLYRAFDNLKQKGILRKDGANIILLKKQGEK